MNLSLDIVQLIESNPITKFSGDYQSKLIEKIKKNFTNYEQQIFLSSFYCYLKYDSKNDFVIDLDNVWKWLGFSQKVRGKELLEKNFTIEKDYKILLSLLGEQKKDNRGGHNKEIIMLNVDTFKKFCLKACTKKADEIHDYFIKLENIMFEVTKEECNELKIQIEQKNIQIQNQIIISENDKQKIREKTLLEQFPKNTQCVYYGLIDNLSSNNEKLIKFGNSNNLKSRVMNHKDTYDNFRLMNAFKVDNKLQIENALKNNELFIERQRVLTIKNKKFIEILNIDGLSFEQLDRVIKQIILSIEFSPENYLKILEQNQLLKKQLEVKNNANDNIILLKTEITRLKNQNLKLIKKYNKLNKEYQNEEFEIQNSDLNEIDYDKEINNFIEKNITPEIKEKNKFRKIIGTREEVWNDIAYKTSGGLIKDNLLLNKDNKIVSKKKSIYETKINRLFEVNKVKQKNSGTGESNYLDSPFPL